MIIDKLRVVEVGAMIEGNHGLKAVGRDAAWRRDRGHGLGEVTAEYHELIRVERTLGGLLLLALGVVLWVDVGLEDPGAGPVGLHVVSGGVFLLAGLVCVYSGLMTTGRRVFLCERGFVDVTGRITRVCPWSDVIHVEFTQIEHSGQWGRESGFSYHVQVRLRNGMVVVFGEKIQDVEDLGRSVMRAVERHQLLALLAEAIGHEGRGDQAAASAGYEEVARRSPYNQIGEQARERLARLRSEAPGDLGR